MNSTTCWRIRAIAILLLCALAFARESSAVFFDLRGLSPVDGFSYNLTRDGVSIVISGQTLRSGTTSFGVDSSGTADAPTLVDGGSGVKEQFDISFGQNQFFHSIQISQFDSVDSGTLTVKGVRTIPLANGIVEVNARPSPTSANTVAWTGDTVSGQGRGFSVDGLTVSVIPEPATLALFLVGLTALPRIRRRK